MGNCYSVDHIAEDHIHKDITCNIKESQQKYRLGTVSNKLLGKGVGLKHVFSGSSLQAYELSTKSYPMYSVCNIFM